MCDVWQPSGNAAVAVSVAQGHSAHAGSWCQFLLRGTCVHSSPGKPTAPPKPDSKPRSLPVPSPVSSLCDRLKEPLAAARCRVPCTVPGEGEKGGSKNFLWSTGFGKTRRRALPHRSPRTFGLVLTRTRTLEEEQEFSI